jgi:hypothetical protein
MPQDLEGHDDKCHHYDCRGLENGDFTQERQYNFDIAKYEKLIPW